MSDTLVIPSRGKRYEIHIKIVIGAVLFLFEVLLNLQIFSLNPPTDAIPAERQYKIDPSLFKTLSFGHTPSAIDWVWMTTLTDSNTSHVKPGTHAQLYYDLDLITDIDPSFLEIYYAGANLLSVVRNDVYGARDLLLKGDAFARHDLPLFPESFRDRYWRSSWIISTLLGYVYLFDLNDMPRASDAFRHAASIPGAPAYLISLGERLQRLGGAYEVGLKLLNFMMAAESDSRVRAELDKKKFNLFVGQFLFEMNHQFQSYLNTQPGYRNLKALSRDQMERYWKGFVRSNQISLRDPWGGTLHLNQYGRIVSSTPHESVFGLE